MIDSMEKDSWSENVILADADYIDKVAFNLIVNFERIIGRRIPKADLARWIDCVALDGGLREGKNDVQVILLHDKDKTALKNFNPSVYDQLNGKAFSDNLGEFTISSFPVEEITNKCDFFVESVQIALLRPTVKRMMIIPDTDDTRTYEKLHSALRHADEEKHITVFAMEPMPGGNFRQEILGFSLMNALGIKSEELK